MVKFLAHALFIIAAWTLTIKFAFPIAWAMNEGSPPLTHVLWDFWWVAHIWLGWALLTRPRYTYRLAIIISALEVTIVVVKLVLFLQAPQWTIWSTNWFINKLFVLGIFCIMLAHLGLRRDAYGDTTKPAVTHDAGGVVAAKGR